MINTKHDILGKLTIQKYDLNGNLVEETVAHNSITKAGRRLVADLFRFNINDDKADKIKRITMMHVGDSPAAFDADHTALQGYIEKMKVVPDENDPISVTNEGRIKLRLISELGEGDGNGALQEAGLFTDDETPIMYNRVTFKTINKSDQFKLTLIWELTF